MTAFTVSTNNTTARTLKSGETGTVTSSGNLHPSGPAITWDISGAAGTAIIDNSGIIAASSGKAIDTKNSATSAQSLSIINHAGATISAVTDLARIQSSLHGGSIGIDNSGLLQGGSGRGINVQEYDGLSAFTLTNHAGATFQSSGDVVRLTSATAGLAFAGTVLIDNSGTISSTGLGSANGQALDLNDLAATEAGHIHVINEAGGIMQAADADAVRTGAFALIDNHGTIQSKNGTPTSTGNDGIDAQSNAGVTINNYQDGTIIGARHGITGDLAITITNSGTITGQLGSGINMDSASLSMSHVTNMGTITGTGGYLGGDPTQPVDGDGVDVDGLVTLNNYGTIAATGVHVVSNDPVTGLPVVELQEAVTIGGGAIYNFAGATITSFERAITADDSGGGGGPGGTNGSNGGNAWAATTIYNEGLIHGGNGEAIAITDTFADTVTNKGVIEGSVATGRGDDSFNLYTGSSISGAIDGGDGADSINLFGAGSGSVANVVHVEALNLFGGDWTLGSEGIGSVDFLGAGTLRIAASLLTDGTYDGTIGGFANVDTIDLSGNGLATGVTLGANHSLTVSGGSGGSVTLHFDPGQSFAGYTFQLSDDGAGGTNLTLAKVINGGNGNDSLTGTVGNDIISGGNGNDKIVSSDGNDSLSGGNGNDVLLSGNGNSLLDGGNGDDSLTAGNGNNALSGGNGDDVLMSGNGNSVLSGGNGDDNLTAGNGSNVLFGDNGDDRLRVGTGDNRLTGGNGNDIFVFGSIVGKDVITDFAKGDRIEFHGTFANFGAVQGAMHQQGADTVIALDANHEITLLGVSAASLHSNSFVFA